MPSRDFKKYAYIHRKEDTKKANWIIVIRELELQRAKMCTKSKSKLLSGMQQEGRKPIISVDNRAKATFEGKWISLVNQISFVEVFIHLLILPQESLDKIYIYIFFAVRVSKNFSSMFVMYMLIMLHKYQLLLDLQLSKGF